MDVVYFIQAGDEAGPVKIGCTSFLHRRLMELRGAHRQRVVDDFRSRLLRDASHDLLLREWHTESDPERKAWLWDLDMLSLDVRSSEVDAFARTSSHWPAAYELLFGRPLVIQPLTVLGTMPGYEREEVWLHGWFEPQRLDAADVMDLHLPHWEWFRPSPALLEFARDGSGHSEPPVASGC